MEPSNLEIQKFTEAFFNNLKCKLSWENESLRITEIPADFEEMYGKKGPYLFTFTPGTHTSAELISKGNTLLKAMTSYLETRGQTTLISLNFDRDYKEEFQRYLKLRECSLYNITKRVENQYILRFTFMTAFQYLNEREQLMNDVYVKEGKIIQFILEKYKAEEGKKEDLQKREMKADFEVAKEELKILLRRKSEETGTMLKKRLDKEIERIKEHYKNQTRELQTQREKINEQSANIQKQLLKENEQEKISLTLKLEKLKETAQELNKSDHFEKLKNEEAFFLNDENHKHALNINNKLMNTTIIYYPVFTFTLMLKGTQSARQIELTYNPLEDTLTPIACETCKRAITEIYLCSSGHIVCQNCADKCRSCHQLLCARCMHKECTTCSIKLCKKCAIKCNKCLKYTCPAHMKEDYLTKKEYCAHCLVKCDACNKHTLTQYTRKTDGGNILCNTCAVRSSLKEK